MSKEYRPNQALEQELTGRVNRGVKYLVDNTQDGLCIDYHHERLGASDAWITTLVGSVLSEFDAVPEQMLPAMLDLKDDRGGWGWNVHVPSDADVTLRALQFFRKVGFYDAEIFSKAEDFILDHQQEDGGIATFLPEDVRIVREGGTSGYVEPHPEVDALALKQLTNPAAKTRIKEHLDHSIDKFGYASFWWNTPHYLAHELGVKEELPVDQSDALELSLDLLRKAKNGVKDQQETETLFRLQEPNGQFPPTTKLRFPDKDLSAIDIISGTIAGRMIPDDKGILTTPIAILALHKQKNLLRTRPT